MKKKKETTFVLAKNVEISTNKKGNINCVLHMRKELHI